MSKHSRELRLAVGVGLLLATVIFCRVIWSGLRILAGTPRFVTYHLAGVHLMESNRWPRNPEWDGHYDFKQNYSIRGGNGPVGTDYSLSLTPGSSWGGTPNELREMFPDERLKLVTGRGVAIGDSPQNVETKIGKPTQVQHSGGNGSASMKYIYIHETEMLYKAEYWFNKGRLRSIKFYYGRPLVWYELRNRRPWWQF